MKEWIVEEHEAGQRLDKYLKRRLPKAPDSFFYKMARKKNLVLNGKKCNGNESLSPNDSIKLFVSDDTVALFSDSKETSFDSYVNAYHKLKNIRVLKETANYLFLYKPSGVLTQKAKPGDLSLNDWLIGYLYENGSVDEKSFKTYHPSVLNRLDRNTSGIVFCAKTTKGSRIGSELIRNRNLKKYYHCIVDGDCTLNGLLEGYLAKDSANNKSSFIEEEEYLKRIAEAKKEYSPVSISVKALQKKYGKTLMEVELHTGKSHQIRVMLSHFGFPIAGDSKYGKTMKQKISDNDAQLLSAVRLEFPESLTASKTVSDEEYSELKGLKILAEAPFSLENFKV